MDHGIQTITPIGSCRIAGPLRVGAVDRGYTLNRAKTYGYTHSSLEAVQQVRFIQGDYHPSEIAWPLMARNHQLDQLKRATHEQSDLYVVEVSSQKQLTFRGHAIQSNYLQKHFADFFSDRARAADFWSAVDANASQSWLSRNWNGPNRKADRQILSDIRRSVATVESLSAHLREIVQRLGNVAIVTHVDARLQNGRKIASRSSFVEVVKRTCAKLDIPCYDPTELMGLIGQDVAIEAGSNSLAHYTGEFERHLADDLMSFFGVTPEPAAAPSSQLDLLKHGRHFELRRKPEQALRLAVDLLGTDPTLERAEWVVCLYDQIKAKPSLPASVLDKVARFANLGSAYRLAESKERRAYVLDQVVSDEDRVQILQVLHKQSDCDQAIETAARLLKDCDVRSVLETEVALLVPAWLDNLCAQPVSIDLLIRLTRLHQLVPGNRQVTKAVQKTKKDVLALARSVFDAFDRRDLERLFEANRDHDLGLIELDLLWCRSLQSEGSFKASVTVAQRLVQSRPDHLTSWILLMRAASNLGQTELAIRAAEQVQMLGQIRSPKHVDEAQVLLDAA